MGVLAICEHYKMKTFNNTVSTYRAFPQFKPNHTTDIRPLLSQEKHKVNDYGMLNKVVVQQLKKKKKKQLTSPRIYADSYSHCQSLDKLASINREKNQQIRKHILEKAELSVRNEQLKLEILNPTVRQQEMYQRIYDLQNKVTKLSSELQQKQYKHKEEIQQLKAGHKAQLAAIRDSYSKMDKKVQNGRFYYQPVTVAEKPLQIVNSRVIRTQSPRRYQAQASSSNIIQYRKVNQESTLSRNPNPIPLQDINKNIQDTKPQVINSGYISSNRQYVSPSHNPISSSSLSPNYQLSNVIATTTYQQASQRLDNNRNVGSYNNVYVNSPRQSKPNTYDGVPSYSPTKIQSINHQNFVREYNNPQKITPDTSKNTTTNTFIYKNQLSKQDPTQKNNVAVASTSNNAINKSASLEYKNANTHSRPFQREFSPQPGSSNSRTVTFANNNAIQVLKRPQANQITSRQEQGLGYGSKGVTAKQIDDIYKRYCLADN